MAKTKGVAQKLHLMCPYGAYSLKFGYSGPNTSKNWLSSKQWVLSQPKKNKKMAQTATWPSKIQLM
jgi:hypothetical protein